jgi:hypothetical protein
MNMFLYGGHTWYVQKKQMKHGYSKILYNQHNKDETIVSVSHKEIIWRTYHIKASKNAEQGIVIQMYGL